ncbi:hypothetical protein AeRB84_001427 [Aphanomyces euteiches]|nr:hypothetical protein AeRB84_001427 [Aphanomyces euteiches]
MPPTKTTSVQFYKPKKKQRALQRNLHLLLWRQMLQLLRQIFGHLATTERTDLLVKIRKATHGLRTIAEMDVILDVTEEISGVIEMDEKVAEIEMDEKVDVIETVAMVAEIEMEEKVDVIDLIDATSIAHTIDMTEIMVHEMTVDMTVAMIIITVLQSFAIKVSSRMFVKMSEVPERESTDGEPQSHVQVGDELEFELSVNRRNGKESAVHIVRLPKGTIVLEDISEDWSTGTVTKSLPPKHKTHSRHASSELFGTIEMEATAASGRKQIVRFSAESFTGHSPRVGDEVQFHISVHRQTSAKRAVDLTITCSASSKREAAIEAALATLERETGVVQSIKGHAGFIKCLSRLQDAYFAVDKTEGIAEGDDVSFFVLPDEFNPAEESGPASRGNTSQQRVTAMRVEKLPPGTVVFEPVVATDVEGTVLVAPPREHARHGFGGGKPSNPHRSSTGQIQGPDGQQLPVHMADVDGGYVPKEGDSVTMDIIEDRRRHMHFAVRVRCKTLNPVDREMGTIGSLKDDFGFIKCFDRAGDVYFRISDVMDVSGGIPLRLGVEASFDLVQTKGKEGLRATRVQLLPKNTIVWETEVQNQATGVLMTVPSAKYNKKEVGRLRFTSTVCPLEPYPTLREQIQTAFDVEKTEVLELKQLNPLQRAAVLSYCCLVGLDAQEKGKEIAVTKGSSAPEWSASITAHEAEADFSLDAIQDVRYEPSEGDTVACSIFLTKRGHHLVAKSIVATSTVVLTKGEGWISLVKSEGYGFIETTHGDSVFFHMSDIEQGAKVKEDDEVSFSIKIQSDKKKKAVGIAVLAPGTLPPKQIRQLEAVVSRASHRQKKKHSTAGKLKVLGESHENEDDDETRNIYAYHVEDQVVPTIVLRPGDIVTCQVRGNGRQATQVALVSSSAKSGVVEVVGVQGGTIAIADSDERVAYLNKSILNGDVALGVGDKVEFALTSPGEDKPVMATHIVRVEGPDRKVGVNSSLRRVLKESGGVATSRMAKGPDGTKGFAAGWQADVMTKTWPQLLAQVEADPSITAKVDELGFTLLHYMCMHPALSPSILESYIRIAPNQIVDALQRSKRSITAVAKCSPRIHAILKDSLGYPKMAVQRIRPLPPRWKEAPLCALCAATFSFTKRRHHCRACGHSVCGAHSRHKVPLDHSPGDTFRVCDDCFDNQMTMAG